MIDTIKAVLGLRCPWCVETHETRWDRFYNTWPQWLIRLEWRVNQFWKVGEWWHRTFHGEDA